MATLELVEKLKEYANVTFEEAKTALDACGDDLLEAIVYLERQGKVVPPRNDGYYSTKQAQEHADAYGKESRGESFGDLMRRFWNWFRGLLHKSCANKFEVLRNGKTIMCIPVIVLILLLVCCFWVTLPLLIIGLFFNMRYQFRGEDIEQTPVNDVMNSVAEAADSLIQEVKAHNDNDREDFPKQ